MVPWLLCWTILAGPVDDSTPAIPTPREVFLSGLAAFAGVPSAEFPVRLSTWVASQLSAGSKDDLEQARLRRRSFLTGMGALFDAGDTLSSVPIVGRTFSRIVRDEEKNRRDAICASARMHGRHDAPRHFFIAAALTAQGGPVAAAQASLVKEIEDARRFDRDPPLGSGFSYLDLAYDHAGIRFATRLLGWRNADRLTEAVPPLALFIPPFPDLELPERIGWQQYCEEYRGQRTEEFLDRIHTAIDARLGDSKSDTSEPVDSTTPSDRGPGGPTRSTHPERSGQSR